MGGSSSSSQTQSQTTQTVTTPTSSTNVGDAYAAQNLTQEFSPAVAAQFSNLVNLAKDTGQGSLEFVKDAGTGFITSFSEIGNRLFDLTENALKTVKSTQDTALQTVTASKEKEANPEFTAVQKYIPLAILAVAGTIAVTFAKAWRK